MADDEFVERRFELNDQQVIARFAKPTLEPGGEYRCGWSLQWPDREKAAGARGIDGVQALLLAMKTVHTQLLDSVEYKTGRLTYLDGRDFDLPPPWRLEGGGEDPN